MLKVLSPAVNTKDVYMKRYPCSRRCLELLPSNRENYSSGLLLPCLPVLLARWVMLPSGERHQEQENT